jgi:hypothetical protein
MAEGWAHVERLAVELAKAGLGARITLCELRGRAVVVVRRVERVCEGGRGRQCRTSAADHL